MQRDNDQQKKYGNFIFSTVCLDEAISPEQKVVSVLRDIGVVTLLVRFGEHHRYVMIQIVPVVAERK